MDSQKIISLIDSLKATCAAAGLGNDGNEFKIIVQAFLYKFLNDKFLGAVRKAKKLAPEASVEEFLAALSAHEYDAVLFRLPAGVARFKREHLFSFLHNKQNDKDFATIFDEALQDLSRSNNAIFSVKTAGGASVRLFEPLSQFVNDPSKRNGFCKAIISHFANFSFEQYFSQKYDFFAEIFEYLIKDYNSDSGGKYAEYFTPHAVARIMAAILAPTPTPNVECYDPAAGSGTLLMTLAHAIGEQNCTIYTQDISQKSSSLLRLNLILNDLVSSIPHVIQGNTLSAPFHTEKPSTALKKFDYIVTNPPFKLDFSGDHSTLDADYNKARFFAGVPNVTTKPEKMPIYLCFIQHVLFSLKATGKAALVVPTGFLTAQSKIEKAIRERMVDQKLLRGVVTMPSNIFASTGTNVSVIFLDGSHPHDSVLLMDASSLGTKQNIDGNQRTVLSPEEEKQIVESFNAHQLVDGLTAIVSYHDITAKGFSFSPGQYFTIAIDHIDISPEDFYSQLAADTAELKDLFNHSHSLELNILHQLERLNYD